MTGKGSVAEPGKKSVKQAANQPAATLTAGQVADYLSAHPNFLVEHPELIDVLTPPSRTSGGAVVDMQHFMLERLRAENQRLKDSHAGLIATVRGNQSTQNRIHAAILRIVAANSFDNLIQSVTIDLPVMLGIDVVTICIEAGDVPIPKAYASGVRSIPAGTIDRKIGVGRDVMLAANVEGDEEIFGSAAGLVSSMALARIQVSPHSPMGLMAFGTRDGEAYHHGQATELLSFLARTTELTIRQWLNLPG
ncbi:DUF484 family protein [Nisaea sp.]|uniref:DUF484 family protein n=1 Tax=Nisaea sp. TaxID=2024842 RepID=UPI0032EBF534